MPRLQIPRENPVEAIVRAAWRRSLFVLTLEQLALALAVLFGGGIAMLLLGTQILNWYWLTLLAVIALAVSIVRTRNRILTRYRVAQVVDCRLHLTDSLSTALFLLSEAGRRNDPVARFQIEQAEHIAASVKPASAFPFKRQRAWVLAGALGTAMFGLFAVRYFVHSSLSFEESLIPIHFGSVLERLEQSLSAKNRQPAEPGADKEGLNTPKAGQSEQNYERNDVPQLKDPNSEQPRDPTSSRQSAAWSKAAEENRTSQTEKSENAVGNENQRRNPGDTTGESREQANTAAPNKNQDMAGGQPPSSGLLEKMKDAVSSLLAKMNSTASSNRSAQNSDRSGGSRTDKESAAKSEQQGQSPNGRTERGRNDPSSEGAAQGQTREKAEASQSRNSDQSPDNNGSDAHSGIGSQNGDKALKEAEQLQAMGKLAEIIGKRSANLTGEVTVETSSGKQRLQTEDSRRVGQHSDSGGEINRDEIPVMYQQYVREYMERVHKEAKSR